MHPIEKLCEEYGVTRYWVAKNAKISEGGLSDMVKDKRSIDDIKLGTLRKISETLETSVGVVIEKLYKYEENSWQLHDSEVYYYSKPNQKGGIVLC